VLVATAWSRKGVRNLICKRFLTPYLPQTVIKEVHVFILVYNLVRLVMLKAAHQQKVSPLRISFVDALRWLQPPKPVQPLPELVVNPVRPERIEPRCIKRRMKEYDLMTVPRRILRKRLKKRRDAA